MYELVLEETCDVITATDGHEALELVDRSVDVVLLDRRMPGMSGDEALPVLRERGYDVPVGMVSGIQPAHDIIELPLDLYLTKPVDPGHLVRAVELLVVCTRFDERCREFLRLAAKKTALEAAGTVDRRDSERFRALIDRMETLRTSIEAEIETLVARQPDPKAEFDERLAVVRDACVHS